MTPAHPLKEKKKFMKIAIIGSRNLTLDDLGQYLPKNCTEIVSGGARGIDTGAKNYAVTHNIPIKEFLPDYRLHGQKAPLLRNRLIVDYADEVYAFWDGTSRGTLHVINYAKQTGKPVRVFRVRKQ